MKKAMEKHLFSLLINTPNVFPTKSNIIFSFLQVSGKFSPANKSPRVVRKQILFRTKAI